MAYQHHGNVVFFGIADQFERAASHLANRAGCALYRVRMHGLDRVDHQHSRLLFHIAERRKNIANRSRCGQFDWRIGQPKPRGAHTDLASGFLAAHIDHLMAIKSDLCSCLQQQRRFADARITAHQYGRARNQPAAQRTVKFCKASGLPNRQLASLIKRGKFDRPSAARQIMFLRKNGGWGFLNQRVPFGTIRALPLPAMRNRAA